MTNLVPNKIVPNKNDKSKFIKNTLKFLIPVITTYLGAVGLTLQNSTNAISLNDFIPNAYVIGGVIVYLQSVLLDYYNKISK